MHRDDLLIASSNSSLFLKGRSALIKCSAQGRCSRTHACPSYHYLSHRRSGGRTGSVRMKRNYHPFHGNALSRTNPRCRSVARRLTAALRLCRSGLVFLRSKRWSGSITYGFLLAMAATSAFFSFSPSSSSSSSSEP